MPRARVLVLLSTDSHPDRGLDSTFLHLLKLQGQPKWHGNGQQRFKWAVVVLKQQKKVEDLVSRRCNGKPREDEAVSH